MDAQAVRHHSASHQALVATWLCSTFAAPRCLQLAPLLLCLPYTPLPVYELLIAHQLERPNATASSPVTSALSSAASSAAALPDKLCRIFEAALSEHGRRAPSLWIMYAKGLVDGANFAGAAAVHARAVRSLDDDLQASFIEEYQRAMAS